MTAGFRPVLNRAGCAPSEAARSQHGAPRRLAVDLGNMHLLNEVTGVIL
jgi:hypothetical protein